MKVILKDKRKNREKGGKKIWHLFVQGKRIWLDQGKWLFHKQSYNIVILFQKLKLTLAGIFIRLLPPVSLQLLFQGCTNDAIVSYFASSQDNMKYLESYKT